MLFGIRETASSTVGWVVLRRDGRGVSQNHDGPNHTRVLPRYFLNSSTAPAQWRCKSIGNKITRTAGDHNISTDADPWHLTVAYEANAAIYASADGDCQTDPHIKIRKLFEQISGWPKASITEPTVRKLHVVGIKVLSFNGPTLRFELSVGDAAAIWRCDMMVLLVGAFGLGAIYAANYQSKCRWLLLVNAVWWISRTLGNPASHPGSKQAFWVQRLSNSREMVQDLGPQGFV
ncbi:uncharacterized protein J3D65DRAFT_156121 [Phyllosticta citribraziliensis]|uniref:Uncharacterized protein n=1 Tax=Phyllosticta citribraziliensis TaxID=989973 RepID=A0ABR1L7H9_9PEZI